MFFFAFMFLVGSWCLDACDSNIARYIELNYENVLSKVTHDQSAKTLKYFCIFLLQRIYLKYLSQHLCLLKVRHHHHHHHHHHHRINLGRTGMTISFQYCLFYTAIHCIYIPCVGSHNITFYITSFRLL